MNILVALTDSQHTNHSPATAWFRAKSQQGWATCPIVENGYVRVVTNQSYASGPVSTPVAVATLSALKSLRGYLFVPEDVSLTDVGAGELALIVGHQQVIDAYLLALCRKHRLRLATLDRRLERALAPGEGLVELV